MNLKKLKYQSLTLFMYTITPNRYQVFKLLTSFCMYFVKIKSYSIND